MLTLTPRYARIACGWQDDQLRLPAKGAAVERISLAWFYQFAVNIHPLLEVKDDAPVMDFAGVFTAAGRSLGGFLRSAYAEEMPTSRLLCSSILETIRQYVPASWPEDPKALDWDKELTSIDGSLIRDWVHDLETVLFPEAQELNVYFVGEYGIHSMRKFVERGELILHSNTRALVPKACIKDLQDAGKCVAFRVFTAAGFHMMRAAETVVREYYKLIVGPLPEKRRSWGFYVEELRKHDAPAKVVSVLDQIRDLHRNPIDHPEVFLDEEDAYSLLGITVSAVTTLAREIGEKRKPEKLEAQDAAAAALADIADITEREKKV